MRTAATLRDWRARFDPLILVVGAVSLIVFQLPGHMGGLSRDLGLYAYAGQEFANGVPPYVGVLNRAGPLAHVLPGIGALGARAVGADDLTGMRILFMLFAVACVCVCYLLGRDLFGSRLVGLAAAGALLSFHGFIAYAANGPREKTPMVLFILLALLAITHRRWFLAGVWVSLATLVLQVAFLPGVAAMLVALVGVEGLRGRLRALVRFGLGGLVPLAVTVVYFLAVGAFREFLDGFLVINSGYTEPNPFMRKPWRHWETLQSAYGVTVWVMLLGLAAVLLASLRVFHAASRRENPSVVSVAACGAATVVALIWSAREFDSWPDAFLLLPLAAVGIGVVAAEIRTRVPAKPAMAMLLAWAVLAAALGTQYAVNNQARGLKAQQKSVDRVLEVVGPDATILVLSASQPLVLSGKTGLSKYQMFAGGLDQHLDDTWPGGLEGYVAWVEEEQPTLIAKSDRGRTEWMRQTLKDQYLKVPKAPPGWTWYVHQSVGPEALAELRAR